jgi:hypothetical protein
MVEANDQSPASGQVLQSRGFLTWIDTLYGPIVVNETVFWPDGSRLKA